MAIALETESRVSEAMLARFGERAPRYDEENRFFTEDFEELKAAGYLTIAVPRELGGGGLSLSDVAHEQRRLAYHAPATALGINMHIYWTGVAADLWRRGYRSLEWLLRDAVKGEVFAAGHAESGNDLPLLLSTTRAERVEGGYRFYGRKSFVSMSPVWTQLGIHGMDASDPGAPKIVHAFMGRASEGYSIKATWDVLGMRATQSEDTVLEGVFVPDSRISRVVPVGAAGMDPFVTGLFAWALLGFGNIYYGLARRAFDWTIETVKARKSLALARSMAYHPACSTRWRRWRSSSRPSSLTWIACATSGPRAWTTGPRGAPRSSPPSAGRPKARSGWSTSRSRWRAALASSIDPASSACSAMRGSAGSIPPTASSRGSSWRRRRSGSTLTSSHAGASEGWARAVVDERCLRAETAAAV